MLGALQQPASYALLFAQGDRCNQRQRQCVENAVARLAEAHDGALSGITYDAVNVMLDAAIDELLALTGKKATEEVVNNIFSRFCVGK